MRAVKKELACAEDELETKLKEYKEYEIEILILQAEIQTLKDIIWEKEHE